MIRAVKPLVLFSSLVLAVTVCKRSADSNQDSTHVAQGAQPPNSNPPIMLRGTVVSVSGNKLILKSDTGTVTTRLTQPFRFYVRAPSDLSQVKENAFIGVTTVKQPDGSERASEIHIFPEELRGVGEGSRMMVQTAGASRMTNGSVTASRMTNGTASESRMSNGNVSSTNGSNLVIQYGGGSQHVIVLPNTPVTELKISPRGLAAGDQVAILAKKGPDGSLATDKAISTAK